MSRQSAGLQKEHEIATEIYEATGGSVMPLRSGFSGNQSIPSPDLLIPLDGSLRAVEMKTSSQDRLVISAEDVEDVLTWSMKMNEIATYPYLAIKFTRYEVQTYRLKKPWDADDSFEIIAGESRYDTNIAPSGNISFGHPTKYDCDVPSAIVSSGDGAAMIRDLYDDNPEGRKDKIGVNTVLDAYPEYWERG